MPGISEVNRISGSGFALSRRLETSQGRYEASRFGSDPDLRDAAVYVSLSSWTSLFGDRISDDRGQMDKDSVLSRLLCCLRSRACSSVG
jgi:hypothetical protein